jgi:hypothetical protein
MRQGTVEPDTFVIPQGYHAFDGLQIGLCRGWLWCLYCHVSFHLKISAACLLELSLHILTNIFLHYFTKGFPKEIRKMAPFDTCR